MKTTCILLEIFYEKPQSELIICALNLNTVLTKRAPLIPILAGRTSLCLLHRTHKWTELSHLIKTPWGKPVWQIRGVLVKLLLMFVTNLGCLISQVMLLIL